MVPCAEMVRFGKNGSDATAGAVRLARAYTGRDRVMACGYHGWQDWYIGSTSRDRGVPRALSNLTHPVPYNDIDAVLGLFRSHPGEFAALILEPMNLDWPRPGYLNELKELVHAEGALLVFDEVVTGFRFAPGGAQELFGVTPDLAALGKGLANGFPLSAVVGRTDLMRLMEEVFFSFTMGGETLSLAAAIATMDKVREHGVPARLAELGKLVLSGLESLIVRHQVRDFVSVAGHPSWSFLVLDDCGGYSSFEIKTLFLQEMFVRGHPYDGQPQCVLCPQRRRCCPASGRLRSSSAAVAFCHQGTTIEGSAWMSASATFVQGTVTPWCLSLPR